MSIFLAFQRYARQGERGEYLVDSTIVYWTMWLKVSAPSIFSQAPYDDAHFQ